MNFSPQTIEGFFYNGFTMRSLIYIIFLPLFFLSFSSHAETRAYGLGSGFPYSSAYSACQAFISSYPGSFSSKSVDGVYFNGYQNGFPSYQCNGTVVYSDGGTGYPGTFVSSTGDSCPKGTEFSESTGECKSTSQKCIDAKGAVSKSYPWKQSSDTPHPPDIGGCATSIPGVAICLPSRSGAGFICTADVTITGDPYEAPAPDPSADSGSGSGGNTGTTPMPGTESG